jgi:hypothetical protein
MKLSKSYYILTIQLISIFITILCIKILQVTSNVMAEFSSRLLIAVPIISILCALLYYNMNLLNNTPILINTPDCLERKPKGSLKYRKNDYIYFRDFIDNKEDLLLCVETSFKTEEEAINTLSKEFPQVKIHFFQKEKYVSLIIIDLKDRYLVARFLDSDWLLAGSTTLRVH